MRRHFGENFTQDETFAIISHFYRLTYVTSYYMLDAEQGTCVFLGLTENTTPRAFYRAISSAHSNGEDLKVSEWVNAVPCQKHDFFLIPHGTVHCSVLVIALLITSYAHLQGKDTLVLEISATPYIFTFKMWDWLRLGLDGQPRPINLVRRILSFL